MIPTVSTHTPRNRLLELPCPECTGTVRVALDELIEGSPFECLHCGTAAELRQDYDTFTHSKRWFLVDPLRERDADEERRT
jgi:hypothetical protein